MLDTAIICVLAIILDRFLGEPGRWHPLAGVGYLADKLEARFNTPGANEALLRRKGAFAALLLVIPIVLLLGWLVNVDIFAVDWLLGLIGLYLCIGYQSLRVHVLGIQGALFANNLTDARQQLSMIAGRSTEELREDEICAASVESGLKQGNDAVFASLFWFVIAGLPGVVAYRLSNALKAMWGHENRRFYHFGWFATKLDRVLNYIPARLTAISYLIAGGWESGLRAWRGYTAQLDSYNGGVMIAAGAGSLGVTLGGDVLPQGELSERPVIGEGNAPVADDLSRTLKLITRSLFLWLTVIVVLGLLL